ncbi:unnamed protein product, partial [Polarella glacialis]
MAKLKIFEIDPMLEGVQGQIWDRVNGYEWWKEELAKNEGGLEKFADGHKIYGWNREDGGWIYREWLPNAKQVFLIGDFNSWQNTTPLKSEGYGRWSVHLPDKADGAYALNHPSQIKVRLETNDGQWHDRVPAWAKLAWQDASTNLFNGVFWEPNPEDRYVFKHPRPDRPENLKIYEAHVGMASIEPKVATYTDFANDVLPRIKRLGYNAVQLMAVAEHAHYGCFGYHVTSFFAPASRQGTPEELKYLVDTAHGLGIQVLMDLVHAHASSNSLDGLAQMDGTDYCYTHGGPKGHHSEWDSKIFNYTKYEVMRFLLSNVKWWLTEYQFDGFRFDGITSMLYKSHGIGKGYTGGYHEYFGPDADIESHIYLMLANDLIHKTVPSAITVGEDVSGMPTLCLPVEDGGFGFDYRLAMAIPDMFIKYLKEGGDDDWDMGHIVHTLTNRRWKEKVVAYCESHDQSIVGDKTLAFWLMDAEMYTGMSLFTQPTPSPCVDRGLALHKMIRLLVLGLGGEAYLTFIGNEFGHPEWVDFPRPENGWSHQHCRRRWDLADDVLLRYKLFQSFEELMQACENRFKFLCASHQYVSCKSEGDKVIVFERGDLVFAFNFHPRNSYEGYQIGTSCDEPMRCILDSDEARFGGHMRLDYNPFPPCGAFNSRPNSVKVCMPSRTCQVLCRQSLLEGGVRIWVEDSFLAHSGLTSTKGLKISKEVWKEGQKETIDFSFNEAGCVELGLGFDATFDIVTADDTVLPCLASKDTKFRVYFPGDYTIAHLGYIKNGKPVDFEATEPAAPAAAAPVKERKVTFPEAKAAGYAAAPVPAAPVTPATPAATPAVTPAAVKAASPAVAAQKAPAGAPAQALPPAQKEAAEGPDEAAAADPRDMARCYSGLHFMSPEALGAALEETKGGMVRQVSEEDQLQGRLQDFTKNLTDIGGDIVKFAQSYKTFGLHKVAGGGWTFCEWMPNAKAVFLVGDFNAWDTSDMPLTEESAPGASGIWSGKIGVAKSAGLTQGSKYKLYVVPEVGEPYYVMPAWASRFVFTEQTRLLDAVVWDIEGSAPKRLSPSPTEVAGGERIYECHPGLAARSGKAASFAETAEFLFPRVARNGYTAVLLQGVLECKEYASMGSQPVGLFAVTRELGTPEELQALVAKAHALGLRVYMDLPHHGAACCEDGLGGHFFPVGADGFHPTSGARLYAYELPEVQRYLLSSLSFWMEIFGMDGFRFQDVGSIIYLDHGRWVPTSTAELDEYLSAGDKLDQAGLQYLMQANSLLHELDPNTCSIAEARDRPKPHNDGYYAIIWRFEACAVRASTTDYSCNPLAVCFPGLPATPFFLRARCQCLILAMLLVLPVLRAEESNLTPFSASYGADVVNQAFSGYLKGSGDKSEYQRALLNYIYYHNWFARAAEDTHCPSRNCNNQYFGQLFWVGITGTSSASLSTNSTTLDLNFIQSFNKNASLHTTEGVLYAYGTMPDFAQEIMASPWTQKCVTSSGTERLGFSLLSELWDHKISYKVPCPENLRSTELQGYSPQLMSDGERQSLSLTFFFDMRPFAKADSGFNLSITFFIMILLIGGSLTFSYDANRLVLQPVEKMIERVEAIRSRPLLAMKMADDEFRVEEMKKVKLEKREKDKVKKFFMDIVAAVCFSNDGAELMETVILEKTIIKLGSLLALGFGEAGADVIGKNMSGSDTAGVNAMVAGRKVEF